MALTKPLLGTWPQDRICRKDLGDLVNGKLSESVYKRRVCLSWASQNSYSLTQGLVTWQMLGSSYLNV